ncbi:hypothetical protein [Sphaerotilus sp.]|uniref:hypothetical protein n=1 Tax=Sphaerotilus sp. TaxID=2093942 RepID=UPI002ACE932D|nr:hypothetical protein [Sphaerotilus sp.]MDZ7855819.1 hypothetical protein [Sphaerotilus sp.]
MERPNALTTSQTQAAALLRRWDRIGVGVRCGYNPSCPCAVRHYLDAGRRVVIAGVRPEQQVMQRLLTVLLQTAHDEALPWYWRSVCLEHTTLPMARLTSLLQQHDPVACHAMHCAVQAAGDALDAAPRRSERAE